MPLRLTEHARQMLEERGIAPEWVARVLDNPDRESEDPRGEPLRRRFGVVPEAGGRVPRVVYRREGGVTVVVTAHFDRGARR